MSAAAHDNDQHNLYDFGDEDEDEPAPVRRNTPGVPLDATSEPHRRSSVHH